ncbi:hypothetical protein O1Q96_37635 [Streptomyces sp. Qhu-G9]|uniref:hypothetical protein n=1 Tax=Streptomyces sp. Qhu-G9 TaxID=3452799 RepID=UPI0022AC3962|nr:hypothetical protein [Streptomyces aurantiacus]WAU84917.1 hypothetical protein O1Q96_37635 [Streptomyces aurantiacus]
MSRAHAVIRRYKTCAEVMKHGVEIFVVGDPAGARLNAAARRLARTVSENDSHVWGDLLNAANALRWRRMTQPQPRGFHPAITEAGDAVVREARVLRGAVADEVLLEEIAAAAQDVCQTDSPVGAELRRSIEEADPSICAVVASSHRARAGMQEWLASLAVPVLLPGELGAVDERIEQLYVVGPPFFFPPSLVTAPATDELTFLMPAWFGHRAIPTSRFADQADGAMKAKVRERAVGDLSEPESFVSNDEPLEETYYPQPMWRGRTSGDREPALDEAEAWKVLLAGNLAIWLDDGDRIRTLDPRQPAGERVTYAAVGDVVPGTYLVLRNGETERGAMYEAALHLMGSQAEAIKATQCGWKAALEARLASKGAVASIAELRARGVRSAARVRAWTEPTLISPKHERDLVLLLEWLGLAVEPSHQNAMALRRAVYRASADLREELEDAVSRAGLAALERDGHMSLEIEREGFRSMVVARVQARSPYTEIVPRPHVRAPFSDRSGKWLE